jgi:hypothetical protein
MAESNVFTVIKSFSENEIKSFRKFLDSPYFLKSEKLLKLFDILTNEAVDELCNGYREKIYSEINPGMAFRDSTIRNLISELNKQLNEFMMMENFRNSGQNKKKHLIAERQKKNLPAIDYFETEDFDTERGTDYSYFLNKHFLESYSYNYAATAGKVTKLKNIETDLLQLENSLKYLHLFYLSQISQFLMTVLILRRTYDIKELPRIINKLSQELDEEKIKQAITPDDEYYYVVELYLSMIDMYRNHGETKYYFKYKECFYKYAFRVSADECSMHISNLSSYCTGKASEGIEEFGNEFFELIELTIKNKYYQNNNTEHLPHEYFRNFLLHGVRLRKFDWVNDFIHENYMKVHPADRENMKQLGFAYLNFNTAQYDEALKNINRITPDFFAFKLDIKNLTVQIFYELGYFEEALSQIKSYKEYLRKDKLLNTEKRKRYFSFLKFTENLVLHRAGTKNTDIGYLRYRISSHKATAFKPWLTEKVMMLDTKARRSA